MQVVDRNTSARMDITVSFRILNERITLLTCKIEHGISSVVFRLLNTMKES